MHKLYCEISELTLGQLYLLKICDDRKITEFWNEKLNQNFSVGLLMKVATGKYKFPSLNFIYAMKDYVAPYEWFYTQSEYDSLERRPEPIAKEEYTDDIKTSRNFSKMQELYKEKKLWKFCQEHFGESFQVTYMTFLHAMTGRNSISPFQIKKLTGVFPVEDWFRK